MHCGTKIANNKESRRSGGGGESVHKTQSHQYFITTVVLMTLSVTTLTAIGIGNTMHGPDKTMKSNTRMKPPIIRISQ